MSYRAALVQRIFASRENLITFVALDAAFTLFVGACIGYAIARFTA